MPSVQPHFDGVTFLERNAGPFPYVEIREFLKFIFAQDEPCWIVNSDILFKGEREIFEDVQTLAYNTIVYGHRIDVECLQDTEGQPFEGGFDYFCISNNLDHIFMFTRVAMCMGQPWWDFWVPLTCIRRAISPLFCDNHIAYHQIHDQAWNIDSMFEYGKMLAYNLGMKTFDRADIEMFTKASGATIKSSSTHVHIGNEDG
jgi:hypothetical protein